MLGQVVVEFGIVMPRVQIPGPRYFQTKRSDFELTVGSGPLARQRVNGVTLHCGFQRFSDIDTVDPFIRAGDSHGVVSTGSKEPPA